MKIFCVRHWLKALLHMSSRNLSEKSVYVYLEVMAGFLVHLK